MTLPGPVGPNAFTRFEDIWGLDPISGRPIRPVVADPDHEARIERLVQEEDDRQEVHARRAAKNQRPIPAGFTLRELRESVDMDAPRFTVEELLPVGGAALLAGDAKVGKSTLLTELIRAAVDAVPFLGRFRVEPSRVAYIDFEMGRAMLQGERSLGGSRIDNADRVGVWDLRGQRAFDIRQPERLAVWVELLRDYDLVILDGLGAEFTAMGIEENSATEVGWMLGAITALAVQADLKGLVVTHHTLKSNHKRARGSGKWDAWPDAIWTYSKAGNGLRTLESKGRNVEEVTVGLTFDPTTSQLDAGRGIPAITPGEAARLTAPGEVTMSEMVGDLRGRYDGSEKTARRRVDDAVRVGVLVQEGMRGNARTYRAA